MPIHTSGVKQKVGTIGSRGRYFFQYFWGRPLQTCHLAPLQRHFSAQCFLLVPIGPVDPLPPLQACRWVAWKHFLLVVLWL